MVLNLRSAIQQDRLDCTPAHTAVHAEAYMKSSTGPVEHSGAILEWGYKTSDLPLPLHDQRSGLRHPPEQPAIVNLSPASQYSIPIIMGSSLLENWAQLTSPASERDPDVPWRQDR